MKYLGQLCEILGFSFVGEVLQKMLPLPIPASIYGLVLLFAALWSGVLKQEAVQDTGKYLISVMGLLFVAPAVNLMDHWALVAPQLGPILAVVVVSTVVVFAVSGHTTQAILKKRRGGKKDAE